MENTLPGAAAPSRRGSRRVRRLPADDAGCGWIRALPPPPPARRLISAERADCAVVGAGFTGLAIARRLAESRPDWRIVVLDAQRAGDGASGRSSGFVVDRAHFVARMEPGASRRYLGLCRYGIGLLREAVREHGLDCDWDDAGWLHAAASEAGAAALPRLAAWLDALGEPYERLDAEGLARITGTGVYRAGLRLPGSVLVQPAALVRGLAATLPGNVELFEESAVRRLRRFRSGGRWRLETGSGSLETDRLFLATNGYSPALGFLARRLFPLLTFGSLTRPLTEAEQQALGGERQWGLLSEDAMGSTVRRTADQRILIRNTLRYRPRLRAGEALYRQALAAHRAAFLARFSALRDVEFESTWSGVMGCTPNRAHAFGALEAELFAAAGYTGAGIAMGTTAGTLLADLALGRRSPLLEDMLSLPAPARLPSQPFLGIGIHWRVARMNASAGDIL